MMRNIIVFNEKENIVFNFRSLEDRLIAISCLILGKKLKLHPGYMELTPELAKIISDRYLMILAFEKYKSNE